MTVEVIQYMRPNGRPVRQLTDIGDRYRTAYAYMLRRGWNLAAEELTTGHISLSIENRKKGEDVDIRVVDNGPGVQRAIEAMLDALMPQGADAHAAGE